VVLPLLWALVPSCQLEGRQGQHKDSARDWRGRGYTSLPSGAPSQKAGKEVSEQSRHLAQKILDAIDYMASPGAPNASPGGRGPLPWQVALVEVKEG